MEEKKDWEQRIVDYSADLMDKHFPKGECKERGKALVFNAKLITYVMGELDRAREEGRREVYEAIVFDKNIPHDVTTFVAANLWKNMRDKAKEELDKLTTK